MAAKMSLAGENPRNNAAVAVQGVTKLERFFLATAALMIFCSSWLLGARLPWSQWTLLALGAALFFSGGLLRGQRRTAGRVGCRPWGGWKFSAAASLVFVVYVAIQSRNISFLPRLNDYYYTLVPTEYITWLPSSVGGEFAGNLIGLVHTENASRYLLIYAAASLGAWGLALGVQASSTLKRILMILLVHGTISSLVCIAHQISGSTKVLWIKGDPIQFLGSPFFFYKNQNAAYQVLLCAWMLAWSLNHLATRPKTAWTLALLGVAGAMSIRSRAGFLFTAVLLGAWLWQARSQLRGWAGARPLRTGMVVIAAVALVWSTVWFSGGNKTVQRLGTAEPSLSYLVHGDTFRRLLHEVALEMFKDRPYFGWGAAGYLYAYPAYEGRVPEMSFNRVGFSYYLLAMHADGDWYEFLVEFGVVGTAFFLMIWLPHLALWLTSRKRLNGAGTIPLIAVLLLLYHALLDQTFRNLGVLFLLMATAILVSKTLLVSQPSKLANGASR